MKPQDFNPNSMGQFWGGQQRNVQNWLGSEEIYALWAPNYMIQAPKSGPLGSSIFPQEQWHSHLMAWPSTMMIKTQMTNHTNFTSSFQLFQDLNILKYIESRSIKSWGLSSPKEWQSWGLRILDFRIFKFWVLGFNNPRIQAPQILKKWKNTKF